MWKNHFRMGIDEETEALSYHQGVQCVSIINKTNNKSFSKYAASFVAHLLIFFYNTFSNFFFSLFQILIDVQFRGKYSCGM